LHPCFGFYSMKTLKRINHSYAVTFDPTFPIITQSEKKVEMKCRHNDSSLNVMLWYQQTRSGGMNLIGYGYTGSEPILEKEFQSQFKMTREDVVRGGLTLLSATESDSAVYFCAASTHCCGSYEAYFGEGTRLTVLDPDKEITPPTKVRVLKPSKNERKNEQKTLVCVASGFYPDHVSVSWKIDDDVVDVTLDHTKAVATDDAARLDNKTYTITSQLIVSSDIWFSNCVFICNVSFFNGTHTVFRDGNTTGGGISEFLCNKYLWITQSAKLSYIIFIAKSCAYGVFIWFVAWKLQVCGTKTN
uniref:Ig-like domain-containing protein n=1 Tax=Oryzias melastigma TaxID=30732 RepID=A0A3B3DXC6_ORYME